jgi:hypothetical protein
MDTLMGTIREQRDDAVLLAAAAPATATPSPSSTAATRPFSPDWPLQR